MLFRCAWASDQNVHQASQSLSLSAFTEVHGHAHPSSLDHLHDSATEMSDADHLLLHALGAFENHVPLDIAVVPLFIGQDMLILQRLSSTLPMQMSPLYRPPKA